jgi:hypothetical protein
MLIFFKLSSTRYFMKFKRSSLETLSISPNSKIQLKISPSLR